MPHIKNRKISKYYIKEMEDTYDALKALQEVGENYTMTDIVREMNLTKEELKEIGLED